MKITTESVICEIRDTHVGNDLRSKTLKAEMQKVQGYLTAYIEDFEKELPKGLIDRFSELDEIYTDYCNACENEAFYYGFKLGMKISEEK